MLWMSNVIKRVSSPSQLDAACRSQQLNWAFGDLYGANTLRDACSLSVFACLYICQRVFCKRYGFIFLRNLGKCFAFLGTIGIID